MPVVQQCLNFFIYSVMIPITASIFHKLKIWKKENLRIHFHAKQHHLLFLFRRQFEKSHCSYYNDLNILKVLILEHSFFVCSIFYRSNYLGHMF